MSRTLLKASSDKMMHPMSYPSDISLEDLFIVTHGDGCYIYDHNGKKYLDAQAGLWCVNVGHNNKNLNKALTEQANKIAYYNTVGNFSNIPCLNLSEKIIEMLAPERMSRVLLSSGGSDSVETALKLSRQYWSLKGKPNKTQILSFTNGFHGLHFGGTSVSGSSFFQEPYGPMLSGCTAVTSPHSYKLDNASQAETLASAVIHNIENIIEQKGAGNIAALIAEPIQGAGGIVVPPASLWPELRKICDENHILLIADEVVTGFGRSGSMFGVRHWNVAPDIMCLAKGLTSGYVPLGATVVNQRIVEAFGDGDNKAQLVHGYTYSGHPLACAVALANLGEVESLELDKQSHTAGKYFMGQLRTLSQACPIIGEVRGKGLMLAVELVDRDNTDKLLDENGKIFKQIKTDILERGLMVRYVGSTIIIAPPLIISNDEIDDIVSILQSALTARIPA